MSALTQAIYDTLAGDVTLANLLAAYKGLPGVFTTRPVPGDAELPYVISAGEVSTLPWDTKLTRGREVLRDIAVYAEASGDAIVVEEIAERVRGLFHRRALSIGGYNWIISSVTGPVAQDGDGVYGRILSLTVKAEEA